MVSSLPFLAPLCMKKARDYGSKYSRAYGGSKDKQARNKASLNGQNHELSDVSNDKRAFHSGNQSVSGENMLDNGAILKSVTYSVRVNEESSSGETSQCMERV